MHRVIELQDHTIISIILSVQFLASLFYQLSISWIFNYGAASGRPYLIPLWIAYWVAGAVTAVLLQRPETWRRMVGLLWNFLLVGAVLFHGGVNWRYPSGSFDGYLWFGRRARYPPTRRKIALKLGFCISGSAAPECAADSRRNYDGEMPFGFAQDKLVLRRARK